MQKSDVGYQHKKNEKRPKNDKFIDTNQEGDFLMKSRKLDNFFTKPCEKKNSNVFGSSSSLKTRYPGKNASNFKQFNRKDSTKEENCQQEKKLFDKKKWRMKKYSNKYKLKKWEDTRQKKILHQFYKEIKDETPGFNVQKIYADHSADSEDEHPPDKGQSSEFDNSTSEDAKNTVDSHCTTKNEKIKPRKRVYKELLRIKQEKANKREDSIKNRAEKEEKLKLYKQKKNEISKKLNRKTKKGQPIMKDRLEMLLAKIQSSCQQ